VAASQTNIESGQPLLAVKNARDFPFLNSVEALQVTSAALMIVGDKFVEDVFATMLAIDLPEEERADRIALHQTIEQPYDLIGSPYDFPLDGRKKVVVTGDLL
jgi:hypothetical protein